MSRATLLRWAITLCLTIGLGMGMLIRHASPMTWAMPLQQGEAHCEDTACYIIDEIRRTETAVHVVMTVVGDRSLRHTLTIRHKRDGYRAPVGVHSYAIEGPEMPAMALATALIDARTQHGWSPPFVRSTDTDPTPTQRANHLIVDVLFLLSLLGITWTSPTWWRTDESEIGGIPWVLIGPVMLMYFYTTVLGDPPAAPWHSNNHGIERAIDLLDLTPVHRSNLTILHGYGYYAVMRPLMELLPSTGLFSPMTHRFAEVSFVTLVVTGATGFLFYCWMRLVIPGSLASWIGATAWILSPMVLRLGPTATMYAPIAFVMVLFLLSLESYRRTRSMLALVTTLATLTLAMQMRGEMILIAPLWALLYGFWNAPPWVWLPALWRPGTPGHQQVEGVDISGSQAKHMLWLANTGAHEDLDLNLDVRAADAIVAQRPLSSVQDLAKLPFVGPSALKKLRDTTPRSLFGVPLSHLLMIGLSPLLIYPRLLDLSRLPPPDGLANMSFDPAGEPRHLLLMPLIWLVGHQCVPRRWSRHWTVAFGLLSLGVLVWAGLHTARSPTWAVHPMLDPFTGGAASLLPAIVGAWAIKDNKQLSWVLPAFLMSTWLIFPHVDCLSTYLRTGMVTGLLLGPMIGIGAFRLADLAYDVASSRTPHAEHGLFAANIIILILAVPPLTTSTLIETDFAKQEHAWSLERVWGELRRPSRALQGLDTLVTLQTEDSPTGARWKTRRDDLDELLPVSLRPIVPHTMGADAWLEKPVRALWWRSMSCHRPPLSNDGEAWLGELERAPWSYLPVSVTETRGRHRIEGVTAWTHPTCAALDKRVVGVLDRTTYEDLEVAGSIYEAPFGDVQLGLFIIE